MPKLSEHVAKLESYLGEKISEKFPKLKERKERYIAIVIGTWYLFGMFVNSIRLGIRSTFGDGDTVGSVWVLNPFRNFSALFTVEGFAVLAVGALLVFLFTKKGYNWFSGHKFTHDARGFDILPDGTHGSSGFMTRKEMEQILDCKPIAELDGTVFGKYKATPTIDDRYAKYISLKKDTALNRHTLVYGASGTGKSRGFVRPFAYKVVKKREPESVIHVDPKGEFYESLSEYYRENGYTVRVFNLLDMENSDGFNVMRDIDADINLVASIADVVIKNTFNGREQPSDFWNKAELNLLMALIHYVQSQKVPGTDRLLPIEQRSLGAIYKMLSRENFNQLEERFARLPKNHPAQGTYGIFKLAPRNIWGNIANGLGTRLTVFQNELVDKITAFDEIDMTLPGQKPCAYFCIIPAQENPYEFLTSLFFSTMFSRLMDFARRFGERGRLPVPVNVCLDEFCNIGDFGFLRLISICRSFNINCQVLTQGVSQLENRYPRNEWQEIVANCDCQIYLGGNDNLTADYISKKCGKVTIGVKNNQKPLTPLFSPIYSSARPYSQTSSNTQRDLMQPDEVLRLPNEQCLVMLRGQKPLLLHKIVPEEFPGYTDIQPARATDYIPHWREASERSEYPLTPISDDPMYIPKADADKSSKKTDNPDDAPEQMSFPINSDADADSWKPKVDYMLVHDKSGPLREEATAPPPDRKYGALQRMGETSARGIIDETINDMEE
jgi:type IV secretion system protein VirD4